MTQNIKGATVQVFKSETLSDEPDYEIATEDVIEFEIDQQIGELKDAASLLISNNQGQYSTDDRQITLGDRIDVYISPQDAPDGYGEGGYGYGGYGGAQYYWSGYVGTPRYIRGGDNESLLAIAGVDYVYGIMATRIVYNNFEQTQISGNEDAILETMLRQEAPEIDRSGIFEVATETDLFSDGAPLLKKCAALAQRTDVLMRAYRDKIVFKPLTEIGVSFTVDPKTDIGLFENEDNGRELINSVRIDGGSDYSQDDEQETKDGYQTVTSTNRLMFQVDTRKSEIDRIEIWTKRVTDESITVRIQKGNEAGTGPIAPDNEESDIQKRQLSFEFTSNDDYTTFIFPNHTLPEPKPWIIIETDGDVGQEIGIDTASGRPAYRSYYPFPVAVQSNNAASIRKYGLREARFRKDNITTKEGAIDLAKQILAQRSEPRGQVEYPALSLRMHDLDPGEIIAMNIARERAVGNYIVTGKRDKFNANAGGLLETTIQAEQITT